MSLAKVSQSLNTAYFSAALGYQTLTEGMVNEPTRSDQIYVTLHFLPGQPRPVTLGQNGEDEYRGFFQVNLHYPKRTGGLQRFTDFNTLSNIFIAGKQFTTDGQWVQINSCGLEPISYNTNYQLSVVSVEWESRIVRPTIV